MYLRTLGHPALVDTDGSTVHKLRKKDLALLVYLCVEGTAVHARGRLASLLWGESPEEAARHSLTQALGRLGRLLPPGSLVLGSQVVRWGEALPCDAVVLLRGGLGPDDVDEGFSIYEGDFLRGFHLRPGAEEFTEWADGRRADLRNAALRLLELAGEDAEERRHWRRATRLAERAVQIEPVAEHAHRRLMRSLASSGERNRALRHYNDLADWLHREMGAEPDPDTRALADQLRAEAAHPAHPPPIRRAPAPPHRGGSSPPPAVPLQPADPPPPEPAPNEAAPSAGPTTTRDDSDPAPSAGGTETGPEGAGPPPLAASRGGRRTWIVLGGLLLAAMVLALGIRALNRPDAPAEQVGRGESLRARGGGEVYLAYAETLWAYPDTATLHACTGAHTPPIREVGRLPPWPHRRLPSARIHGWMGGTLPVKADDPEDRTAYVAVGCILAGVPDPPTLDSIFGYGALERMVVAPADTVASMPRDVIADGQPVRRAGTLIRSPSGFIRWITYHGGALVVADSVVLATYHRAPREAIDVSEAEFRYYRPFAPLHPARAQCRRKD